MTGIGSHFSKQNWLDQAHHGEGKIGLQIKHGNAVLCKAKTNLCNRAFATLTNKKNQSQKRAAAFDEFQDFMIATYGKAIGEKIFEDTKNSCPKGLTGRNIEIAIRQANEEELKSSDPYRRSSQMQKASIDQKCEEKFAQKAEEFELKMAQKIMQDDRVGQTVDTMLARVHNIVNAWAEATGRSFAETCEREFVFEEGEKYYGSIDLSAGNINDIFQDKQQDKQQPMRVKLKLIYNVVRNNNFQKWLKCAAIEMDRTARGKAPRDLSIKTATAPVTRWDQRGQRSYIEKGVAQTEIVQSGFAESSGFAKILSPKMASHIAKVAQSEKMTEDAFSKEDVFGPDRFSALMKTETEIFFHDRSHDKNEGVHISQQRTLTSDDVPDLTDAEINLILKRDGNASPNDADRARIRNDKNTKILWEQGRDAIEVLPGSTTDKEAAKVNGRLEGGISGSTSLMLNAAKYLGMGDAQTMKSMRLALAGWMVANHDHTFYEVFKAAELHGVPFENNPRDPGNLYESESNFEPMKTSDFSNLLDEKKFPGFFKSEEYKSTLANGMAPLSLNDLKESLRTKRIPDRILQGLDERATAELTRLDSVVSGQPINRADPMPLKKQGLHRIREHSSYTYLSRTFNQKNIPLDMTEVTEALVKWHHQGKGLVPSKTDLCDTMADIGIPDSVLRSLPPNSFYDLEAVRYAAQNASYDPMLNGLSWVPPNNGEMERLSYQLGQKEFDDIKALFLQTYQGDQAIGNTMAQSAVAARNSTAQVDPNVAFIAPFFGQNMQTANDTAYSFFAKGVSRNSIIPAFKMAKQFLDSGIMNWADAITKASLVQRGIQKGQINPIEFNQSIPSQNDIDISRIQGDSLGQFFARQKVATFFHYAQGISTRAIESYLEGIDFSKPVEVGYLKPGMQLQQYVIPGSYPSGDFCLPGTPASDLGISSKATDKATGLLTNRIAQQFVVLQEVMALLSSASDINDTWSIPGRSIPTKGGGTQFFTRDPASIQLQP